MNSAVPFPHPAAWRRPSLLPGFGPAPGSSLIFVLPSGAHGVSDGLRVRACDIRIVASGGDAVLIRPLPATLIPANGAQR